MIKKSLLGGGRGGGLEYSCQRKQTATTEHVFRKFSAWSQKYTLYKSCGAVLVLYQERRSLRTL